MMLTAELKQFIAEHENDDIKQLALQAKKYPQIDMQQAIQQIYGRRIAKEKIPTWYENKDIIYPAHLSMEQCSSEHTAIYKAKLWKGETMVDLTGGFGIDFSFFARNFQHATYVEQQNELVEIAKVNFVVLGQDNTNMVKADAVEYLQNMPKVDLIYLDPARRNNTGGKTVLIQDCTPNIVEIEKLLEEKSEQTIIKLSPMLDISLALNTLRDIADVYIISHLNECKELLLVKSKGKVITQLHCVNIKKNETDTFTFSLESEKYIELSYTSTLGKYLYEPNSAIIKAGAYKSVAKQFKLSKLHVSSHLYTSNELCTDFHGRKFEIITVSTLNKKDIKTHLGDLSQANITTRNFPLSVSELRKRLKLKDGGDTYIFATTLADNQKVLVLCKRL